MLLRIVCLLAAALPAAADFQAGLQAYERKDYATAVKEWQPLAEKGDANAQYNMGLPATTSGTGFDPGVGMRV